jgi:hypothetical protein
VPHISPDEDPHSDITELNDEEDNDEDDKSDTEDDAVVDSVDALPDFFTEYWDVLEEEPFCVPLYGIIYPFYICFSIPDN